jgi:hypothetical protein
MCVEYEQKLNHPSLLNDDDEFLLYMPQGTAMQLQEKPVPQVVLRLLLSSSILSRMSVLMLQEHPTICRSCPGKADTDQE